MHSGVVEEAETCLGLNDTDPQLGSWEDRDHAIRQLYEREHQSMVRLAALILGDQGHAEEVVHDAFVALLESGGAIANAGGYLRSTVVNRCTSLGRRLTLGRRKLRLVSARDREATVSLPVEVDETWAVLGRLKPAQRAALVLRYYEDLPVNDIALVMDVPAGTVKSLIHRGLAALEQELTFDEAR